MTVAPRGGGQRRELARGVGAGREQGDVDALERLGASASPISSVRPSTETVRPADRSDASSRSSPTGNSRSRRTWIIVRPTTPVAPTTATVRVGRVMSGMAPLSLSLAGHPGSIAAASSGPRRTPLHLTLRMVGAA